MDATAGTPAYSAKNARQAQSALYGAPTGAFSARSGWRVGTATGVVSVTSTQWTLNPAAAMISPAASLYQGSYGWASDQVITGPMTAADATNPRKDILYIQINDSSAGDGSGALSAPVMYLAGAATATPVAPTLPARSFLVGTISVPKSGGGSPTVALNQTYFVASGAPMPVNSQAERDAFTPYMGMLVTRLDTGVLEEYFSGAWAPITQAPGASPYMVHAGTATVSIGVGTGAATLAVTFPQAFTRAPIVAVNIAVATGNNSYKLEAHGYNKTPTGFTVDVRTIDGTGVAASYDIPVDWIAIQMTPASAAG